MKSVQSDEYLAELHEQYARMPPIFKAKAPLFSAISCLERAMQSVGVNSEAEMWINKAQARMSEAKAIIHAAQTAK